MFFLFLNVPKLICMSYSASARTTGFFNCQPLPLFFISILFAGGLFKQKPGESFLAGCCVLSNFPIARAKVRLVECRGILIRFKLIH